MWWFAGIMLLVPLLLVGELLLGERQGHLLFLWVGFLLLVLFPGPRPEQPRLFLAVSALWVLSALLTLLVLVGHALPGSPHPLPLWEEVRHVPLVVLVPELILMPALLVTLWKGMAAFRPLIAVATLLSVTIRILGHGHANEFSLGWPIQGLALGVCLDIAVAFYLLLHFRIRRAESR